MTKIELNRSWRVDNGELKLSTPITGKFQIILDGVVVKSLEVWNRDTINSVLKLLKMYCDWIETENHISLKPIELQLSKEKSALIVE